jgi:hypothetical protein
MKIWGSGDIAPPFLTLALDGGEWLASRPWETAPGTHFIGGLVGPRAGLDIMEKDLLPLPKIKPRFLSRPACSLVILTALSWLPLHH